MRFLIGADVPPDPNSGAGGTVYWTNQALRDLGHEVDEFWQDDLPRHIAHGNLHDLLELPRTYRGAVRRHCAMKEYDVIMLSQPHAWLAAKDHRESGRPGVFINRSHGVENMVDEVVGKWQSLYGMKRTSRARLLPSLALNRLLGQSFSRICKYADGIVVGAQDNADYIISRYDFPPERIKALTEGVGMEFLHVPSVENTPERFQHVLYVGQFTFVKAPQVVANVFSQIAAMRPDVGLTWVCSRQHHAQARALLDAAARPRVDLVDWMSQDKLVHLYDQHGIFLFPSFFEGCGKAALEAMARGMCVVASNVGGMADVIRNNQNGILRPPGSVDDFVRATSRLLANPLEACDMGRHARETSKSLSWKKVAVCVAEFAQSSAFRV